MLPLVAGAQAAPLTTEERTLIAALDFDAELLARVRPLGQGLERLQALTADHDMVPAKGIALITVPTEKNTMLDGVRAALAGTPYSAWLREQHFGFAPDKIAIMKTHDDYAFLAVARTDGINFDIDHAKVLAKYRQWQKQYGLELLGADLDWFWARITRPPQNWMAFAREVHKFCPDVVDQGTGTVKKLGEEMRRDRELYCWWD